jgi:predicted TIM-barrel fold metal-dependent hydrolase
MTRVARLTPALCKIFGIVNESAKDKRPDDVPPYIDRQLVCFDPWRLMWGT